MGDDWFGHRHWLTGDPQGDKDEWTQWDYILSRVLQTYDDFTNDHGLARWEVDDPKERVDVGAERKTDKFQAAMDRITGKDKYKPSPGEYFIPKLELRASDWPTFGEYMDHLVQEAQDEADPEKQRQAIEDFLERERSEEAYKR